MKRIITLFLSLSLLLSITSCSRQQETIHIGYESWAGYQPIIIAKEKHFFEQEGVKVRLHYFTSFNDLTRAFSEGKIDVMLSTTNEVLLLADKGEKLKIVLLLDYSNGADAIVAQPSIQSVADLKGKKIALETNTISHFLLLKALEKANIKEDDVKLINVEGDESVRLFKNKSIDAVASWAPYIARLIKKNGHIIFSSSLIPGEIIDVMSIKQQFINEYPRESFKLVSAYLKAQDWLHDHTEEGYQIIGKNYIGGQEGFAQDIKHVKLARLPENVLAFGTPEAPGTVYIATKQFMLFLLNKKLINDPINTDQLIDPTFIKKYEEKNKR